MGKVHGKKGVVYLGETVATKVANLSSWSIDLGQAIAEDTDFDTGTWREIVKGIISWSGSLEGYYNDVSKALFDAAISGTVQKLYLYPTTDSASKYFYGTVYPDFSIEVTATDVIKISGGFEGTGALGHIQS